MSANVGWGPGEEGTVHVLTNYIDATAKCRHLKILTCTWTLRQVFIRVYRLEIQSVSGSTPPFPLPCVKKYTVYIYTVGKGGGIGVLGLRQINTCHKVSFFK